jgi:hypothetical protein
MPAFSLRDVKMAEITLDKAVVEEVVTTKMRVLQQYIDEMLQRWNEPSAKSFLENARNGVYKNDEDDAVELRQLLLDYKKYQNLFARL